MYQEISLDKIFVLVVYYTMSTSADLDPSKSKVSGSNTSSSLDFNVYIKEWLDLEKYMLLDYNYTIVEGAERDEYRRITSIKDDSCFVGPGTENKKNCQPPCKLRKQHWHDDNMICAEERHLKSLNKSDDPGKPNIFTSADQTQYTILDSAEMIKDFFSKNKQVKVFYRILKSGTSGNIYILFSSYGTIDVRELTNELSAVVDKIFSYNNFSRIVICGHSMGCMIGLHFAKAIYNKNNKFFENKCAVIGTGPYKGYYYDDPLPNTKIFVYGIISSNDENRGRLAVDGFLYESPHFSNKKDGLEKHYKPVIIIIKKIDDENSYELLNTVEDLRFHNNNDLLESLHDFTENYYDFFKNFKTDFNTVGGDLNITNAVIDKLMPPEVNIQFSSSQQVNTDPIPTKEQTGKSVINLSDIDISETNEGKSATQPAVSTDKNETISQETTPVNLADIKLFERDEEMNEEGIIDNENENEKNPLDTNTANATESANKQSESATYYAQLLTRLSLGGNTFKFDRNQTDFLALLVLLKLKVVGEQCEAVDKGILAKSRRLNTYIQYYKKIAESKQTNYWKIVKAVLSDLTEICGYTKKTKFKDDVTSEKIDEIEESLVKELDIKTGDKTAFLEILKTKTFTETYLPKDFKKNRVAEIKHELFGSDTSIDVKDLLAKVREKFPGLSSNAECETFFSEQYVDENKPIEEYDREYKDVCRPYLQSYLEALMADDPAIKSEKPGLLEAIQQLNEQHDQHIEAFKTVFDKFDIKFTAKNLAQLKIEHKNADMKILEQLQEDLQLQGLIASAKNIDLSKADWVTKTLQDFSDRADAIIELFRRKLEKSKEQNMKIRTLIEELKQKNIIAQETINMYNIKIENYETKNFKLLFKEQIDRINENIQKIAEIIKNIGTWKAYCTQFKSLLSEINTNVHTGRDLTFQLKCQSYLNENADDATIVAGYDEFEKCIKENYMDKIVKDIQRVNPSFTYVDDSTKTLYSRLFNLFDSQKEKITTFQPGVQNPLTKFKQILDAKTQAFLDKHFKVGGSKEDFIKLIENLGFDGFRLPGNVTSLLKPENLNEDAVVVALKNDIIKPLKTVYNKVLEINGKATDDAEKTVLQLISSIKSEVSRMQQIFKATNGTKIEFTRYNGLVTLTNLEKFDAKNKEFVNKNIGNDWNNYRTNMPVLLESISTLYHQINPETPDQKTCDESVFGKDNVNLSPATLIPWFMDFQKCVRENYCAEFCTYDTSKTLTENLEKIKSDLKELAPFYEGGTINFMKFLKMVSEDLEKPDLIVFKNVEELVGKIKGTLNKNDRDSEVNPNLHTIIENLRTGTKTKIEEFNNRRICKIDFDKHYLTKNFKLLLKKKREDLDKNLAAITSYFPGDVIISPNDNKTKWEKFCDKFNELLSEIDKNIHTGVDLTTMKLKCSAYLNKDSDDVAVVTGYGDFVACIENNYIAKIEKDIQRFDATYKASNSYEATDPIFTKLEKVVVKHSEIIRKIQPNTELKKIKQLLPAKTQAFLDKHFKVGGSKDDFIQFLNRLSVDEFSVGDIRKNLEAINIDEKAVETDISKTKTELLNIYAKLCQIYEIPFFTESNVTLLELVELIKSVLVKIENKYKWIPKFTIVKTDQLGIVTSKDLEEIEKKIKESLDVQDNFVKDLIGEFGDWKTYCEYLKEILTHIDSLQNKTRFSKLLNSCDEYLNENSNNIQIQAGNENFKKCIKQYFVNSIGYNDGDSIVKNLNNLYIKLKLKPYYGNEDVKVFLENNSDFPGAEIPTILLKFSELNIQNNVFTQVEDIITESKKLLDDLVQRYSDIWGTRLDSNIVDGLKLYETSILELVKNLYDDGIIKNKDLLELDLSPTDLTKEKFAEIRKHVRANDYIDKSRNIIHFFDTAFFGLVRGFVGAVLQRLFTINGYTNKETPKKIFETIKELQGEITKAEQLFGIKIERTKNLQLVTMNELQSLETKIIKNIETKIKGEKFKDWNDYKSEINKLILEINNALNEINHMNSNVQCSVSDYMEPPKMFAWFNDFKKCIKEKYSANFYKYDEGKIVNDNLELLMKNLKKVLELKPFYEGSFSDFQIFVEEFYKRHSNEQNGSYYKEMIQHLKQIREGNDIKWNVDQFKIKIGHYFVNTSGEVILKKAEQKKEEYFRQYTEFGTFNEYITQMKKLLDIIDGLQNKTRFSKLIASCDSYLKSDAKDSEIFNGYKEFKACIIKQYFTNPPVAYDDKKTVYENLKDLQTKLEAERDTQNQLQGLQPRRVSNTQSNLKIKEEGTFSYENPLNKIKGRTSTSTSSSPPYEYNLFPDDKAELEILSANIVENPPKPQISSQNLYQIPAKISNRRADQRPDLTKQYENPSNNEQTPEDSVQKMKLFNNNFENLISNRVNPQNPQTKQKDYRFSGLKKQGGSRSKKTRRKIIKKSPVQKRNAKTTKKNKLRTSASNRTSVSASARS